MNIKRHFAIPATAMNLALTAGCTPAVVGDWTLTDISIDGDELDLSYSVNSSGYNIEVDISVDLSVDDDLEAKVKQKIRIKVDGDLYSSDSYTLEGEAEKAGGGEWDISVEDDTNDLSIDVTCTVEDEELQCEGENESGDDLELTFEAD